MLADPTYDLRAGGSDLARFSADVKSACLLEADGFVIDTVVWIAPSYGSNFRSTYESNWSLDTSSWSEAVRRAGKAPIDVLTDLASKAASQRNLDFNDTAFTLALVQGYYQADPDLERHRSSFENYRHVVRAAVLEAGGSGSVIFPDNVLQSATGTANALREHHRGKSVFLTKSGRFGLANSAAMEVRDVCCIFLGATVPFVLAPAGRGRYRLVGEAYLHGVMAGELVHQYKHGTVVLE
ncbi:hypothetical protein E8E12_008168 [Didymella heteroderae]|uniref:Uncharacterized protein n=1 Tax=Didymella heteroderae TaxID=1769908 RepID=A0A9P5C2X2_9PLEO|nr:hypothetical protein E8E12_008168 [Didymella heteroderae]